MSSIRLVEHAVRDIGYKAGQIGRLRIWKMTPHGAAGILLGILTVICATLTVQGCSGTDAFCSTPRQRNATSEKKGSEPNFLRFGKRAAPSPNSAGANFLRFGKSGADPNFLRFGKRAAEFKIDGTEPNFLRFGKRPDPSAMSNNFLRFGKRATALEKLDREARQSNNFLRFG
ncbi:unnamed protein product [Bursaphelenchus okinawaensis]|uniref:Uncharacterized protein n=1 Tax=Bursaphelenchus okinawaensis TaxID=465554 RepID=A0A811KU37_9BILA|nr:unnamed protein product [Bursaphelenchus okinawaensis]CAG9110868.1 unnamed protein product [Bursaphelenchus okinawaensis]